MGPTAHGGWRLQRHHPVSFKPFQATNSRRKHFWDGYSESVTSSDQSVKSYQLIVGSLPMSWIPKTLIPDPRRKMHREELGLFLYSDYTSNKSFKPKELILLAELELMNWTLPTFCSAWNQMDFGSSCVNPAAVRETSMSSEGIFVLAADYCWLNKGPAVSGRACDG